MDKKKYAGTQRTQGRQPWETAGVTHPDNAYGMAEPPDNKGGSLSMQVDNVLHNEGIMGKKPKIR